MDKEEIMNVISQLQRDVAAMKSDIDWIRKTLDKMDKKIESLTSAVSEQRRYTDSVTDSVKKELSSRIDRVEGRVEEIGEFVTGMRASVKVLYAITSFILALVSIIVYMGGG